MPATRMGQQIHWLYSAECTTCGPERGSSSWMLAVRSQSATKQHSSLQRDRQAVQLNQRLCHSPSPKPKEQSWDQGNRSRLRQLMLLTRQTAPQQTILYQMPSCRLPEAAQSAQAPNISEVPAVPPMQKSEGEAKVSLDQRIVRVTSCSGQTCSGVLCRLRVVRYLSCITTVSLLYNDSIQ